MRTILQIFALYCISCGFPGEPPFETSRPADVAPWHDLGRATFCDGATRLGPPASDAAGFCAAAPSRTFAVDGDCGSRERCVCGLCRVPACASGDECPSGWTCSFADGRCDRACTVDADCAKGETCAADLGVCRGACAGDGDCQAGETCQAGTCATTACAGDGDCGGSACAVERVAADLREPSPLATAAGVVMWVERDGAVWRAVSTDGVRFRFDPRAPVIAPATDDAGRAGAPSVMATGGGFLAAYANGAGDLRLATSSDGIVFAPAGTAVAADADSPSLASAPAGGVALYYAHAGDLALATSPDGKTFTGAGDVLAPGAVAATPWLDVTALQSPFAEAADGPGAPASLRVYFAARGKAPEPAVENGVAVAQAPYLAVGVALTVDGTTLAPWPYGAVFDRVAEFTTHLDQSEPATVTTGDGRHLLYYVGAGSDGKPTGIGVAENP